MEKGSESAYNIRLKVKKGGKEVKGSEKKRSKKHIRYNILSALRSDEKVRS